MSEKIFFGKQKNDDRDCCVYIERPEFECGHYYSLPRPTGPCYSSSWDEDGEYNYDYLDTVLTEEEYDKFRTLIYELDLVRNGLDKDEEKKKLADAKVKELNKFIDDYLLSDKAEEFRKKIQEEEDEYLKKEYGFDDEDIEQIHNEYGGDYFDRGIVGCVYDDSYAVADRWVDECCNVDDWIKNYIDYDKMGDDIVSDGDYVELSDGRIVEYNC